MRLAPAGDFKKRLTPVQSRVGCLEPHSKPAHAGDHQSFTSDLQSPGCDCDASTRRNLPTARGRKARRLAPQNGSLFAVRRVGSGGSRRAQGGRRSDAWRGAAGTQTVPRDVCPSAITAFARWRRAYLSHARRENEIHFLNACATDLTSMCMCMHYTSMAKAFEQCTHLTVSLVGALWSALSDTLKRHA